MKVYFFKLIITFLLVGLIPFLSCEKHKCKGGQFEIAIDGISSNLYLRNNDQYDSLKIFEYKNVRIGIIVSDYHMAANSTDIKWTTGSGNLAYACPPIVHHSKDRIKSITIISSDTLRTNSKNFLPGEDISELFSFVYSYSADSTEVNKDLSSIAYFLNPDQALELYFKEIPDNHTISKYEFDLNFDSGKNIAASTNIIQLK